jgi:outer membrane receptor protein involved in Fe transport
LFGKNTAAGAFNITTRKPSFTPGLTFETSFGNYGYVQAKAAITGPLSKTIAHVFHFLEPNVMVYFKTFVPEDLLMTLTT